ncbi:MAG: type II toxin-antitoxin system VapB family antitoxin, partial [Burkholderiales bacterium]
MKTTIEISDSLFNEAKKIAARDGTTVKTLVEHGLRHVISQRKRPH